MSADEVKVLVDIVWTMFGACLVYFMQAGFAMVETGFTRAKNAGNIIMKNMMDFVIGSLCFFVVGYGIMFGTDVGGIFGSSYFFGNLPDDLVAVFFQTVFCATSATIVSGAMAERTNFVAYLLYSACISLFIYPVSGHWIWGGGWLSQMGFHDFAGSTAVHMVGGTLALIGAKILGPRLGKYDKKGNPNAIPGHNIPIGALGVFILWFCWFGFNCGSTVEATPAIGAIAMTTNLAAAAATLATLLFTWLRYGKPDVSMTLNGSLAGLVAITAGCDVVSNWAAIIIGLIAGILVVFAVEFIDKKLKIDDPVGAASVHGVCGATGTILTGVFSSEVSFLTQLIGVATVIAYTAVIGIIIFKLIDKAVGLRCSAEEEEAGLDISEHGMTSYADFPIKP